MEKLRSSCTMILVVGPVCVDVNHGFQTSSQVFLGALIQSTSGERVETVAAFGTRAVVSTETTIS